MEKTASLPPYSPLAGLALLPLLCGTAFGAGNEREVSNVARILFESDNYAEFGTTYIAPRQVGPAANTGNLLEDYWKFSSAIKTDINDQASFALIFDQPYGNNANYRQGTLDGTKSEINSYQFTAAMAYDVTPNVKLFGGLRAQGIDAMANVPAVAGYTIDVDRDWRLGYVLGGAYHIPEIALRVALTYTSKIEHTFDITETTTTPATLESELDVETPQSVQLDFQTGVAPDTLVFGSVRWVDWSVYSLSPSLFSTSTGGQALAEYLGDWWTYSLGVGRKFNDQFSGALQLIHEPSIDKVQPTTGPYDGRTAVQASLKYTLDSYSISGGLTYGVLGDAENGTGVEFNDGSYWGAGIRVGVNF